MNRRRFLFGTGAATLALPLLGCKGDPKSTPSRNNVAGRVDSSDAARTVARPKPSGKVIPLELSAGPVEKSFRGVPFNAFGYNGQSPGPEIRIKEGETLRVQVHNHLPDGTSIHWHGVPVPNPMDGVPGVTQESISPGQSFTYEFMAWPAGTCVYHTHQGYQLDQGLYGPLIIEEQRPAAVDREFVLILEDWAAVNGGGPAAARAGRVSRRGMMGGMMGPGMMGPGMMGRGRMGRGMGSGMMGRGMRPDAGDEVSGGSEPLLEPLYDTYAVNGKLDPPGEVLRTRESSRSSSRSRPFRAGSTRGLR